MDLDIVQLISQVGFPIAIAVFVLVRLDHSLKSLHLEIVHLGQEIRRLSDRGGVA